MTHPAGPRCAEASGAAGEPLAGTAPRADIWVVVEHPEGWGDAQLARAGHGVRVVMARGARGPRPAALRVWVAHCTPDPALRVGTVADPSEVARWDLRAVAQGTLRAWGRPVTGPLLALCANGRRDRCCGHAGGRLADSLWSGAERDHVVTCTHLGGHRFAPTALLLPWGVLHGRLDLRTARAVLADARAGRTPGATLRGFSALSEPAQVAEAHARTSTRYEGLAPLRVELDPDEGGQRAGLQTRIANVRLPDGGILTVPLVRRSLDLVSSCGRDPEPTIRWSVRG